ncbi:MAG: CHAT domain-containing protein, partial [Pseudomonadota bacterium]
GMSGQISEERRQSLRETAEKASRLSELQRSAYTSNTLLKFSAAEQNYRETLTLARQLFPTDPARASSLRLHLALNKSNLGQYEQAENLFTRSRDIVVELGAPSEQAKPDLFYSQHKMNLKQYADAERIARDSVRRLDQLIPKADATGEGERLDQLSFIKGDDGALLISQERANVVNARITRDTGIDDNAVRLTDRQRLQLQRVQARYVVARAMRSQGKPESEVQSLIAQSERDLNGIPEVFGRWLRAEIASIQADAKQASGDSAGAIADLDRAIDLLRKFEIDSRPEALLLFKKGEILILAKRGREGTAAYRKALEILRNDEQGLEMEQAQTIIDRLLEDVQAGDIDAQQQLFQVMQKVRSSATAQTVSQLSARLSSGAGDRASAIREIQDLERESNVLAARFDRLEADPDADFHYKRVTEAKLDEVRGKLANQRELLRSVAPNYEQLVDSTVTLEAAQAALKDGEVMVAIQLGADSTLVAAITNLSFDAYTVAMNVETAEEEVKTLRAPIDGEFIQRFDLERSHKLFREFFGPVSTKILDAEHVIVVPSGPLLSLPFNTLVTEAYDEEIKIVDSAYFDYSEVKWLGAQVGLTTAVSISSFFLGRQVPESDAPRAFRGFGDFKQFGQDQVVVDRIAQNRGLPDTCKTSIQALGLLSELGGTKQELEKVQAALGIPDQDVVLGNSFTDGAIKDMRLSEFRVLHFATHGLLAQDPECLPEPGLITSLGDGGDSLLEASEIVDLNLNAELVVMSACDTSGGAGAASASRTGFRDLGGGYAAGGESLSGLARSFFFAGARNVLSTFWSVDDFATQELMTGFYGAVAEDNDISIAEAMRKSQADRIEGGELSHPFFWAPFATIGDGARKLRLGKEKAPAPTVAAPQATEETEEVDDGA